MKRTVLLLLVVFVAVLAWRVGGRLSPDALGVAVGVVFGVLASVPAALLVLAADRRSSRVREDLHDRRAAGRTPAVPSEGYRTPVIVVAPPGAWTPPAAGANAYGLLPDPRQTGQPVFPGGASRLPAERTFRVVGEPEELIDDW